MKILRRKKGLTQADLAKAAHVAQSIVSDIENGNRTPRTDTLLKLSNVLGVHLSMLIGEEDSNE